MARKPTLSPSKITTYLACPVKYKWTYVDERGRWYFRAKHQFSFGTTLHKVLQRFHDSGDTGVETVDQALAALEESWIDAGYKSAQEMQEALSEGKTIVATYVDQAMVDVSQHTTLFVEKQFRHDLGAFVLIGRMDRVDQWEDGTIEVVDYKSGRATVTDQQVENDLAMACYQLLATEHYPGLPVRVTIIALRSNSRGSASMTAEQLAEFKQDIVQLGEEILSRDYEALAPVYKSLCPSCDFLPLCRRHEDWSEPDSPESVE